MFGILLFTVWVTGLSHTVDFLSTSDREAGVPGRLKVNVRQQGIGAVPGEKGNQAFGKHLLQHHVRDTAGWACSEKQSVGIPAPTGS